MGRPKRVHTRSNRVNPGRHIAGGRKEFTKTFKVGVDSGNILIGDAMGAKETPGMNSVIPLAKGVWQINFESNDWRGSCGESAIKIHTGEVIISDPCLVLKGESYDTFMRMYESGGELSDHIFMFDTGGDGLFDVKITFIPIP